MAPKISDVIMTIIEAAIPAPESSEPFPAAVGLGPLLLPAGAGDD